MTATAATVTTVDVDSATPGAAADRPLRRVLRLNAASSLLFGVIGLAAAPTWSERSGLDSIAATTVVAAGLVVFAAATLWVAARPVDRLRPLAVVVSAADLAWVGTSVVMIALGSLTTAGAVVAGVVALGVADLAIAQLWFRERIAHPGARLRNGR
ncbi:MAG: hypothetical protein ACFCVK_03315 [Acidimicrobiales bacterium]